MRTITTYINKETKRQQRKQQNQINKRTKSVFAINRESVAMLSKNHHKHLSTHNLVKESKGIKRNNKKQDNYYIPLASDSYKYSDYSTMRYKQKQHEKTTKKKRRWYA